MSQVYLGWVHNTDGTSTATKWFSLVLPLFPLGTHRVIAHPARPVQGNTVSITPAQVQVGWIIPPRVEALCNVALDIRGILRTYILYWLLFPMAIASPFLADMLLTKLISGRPTLISESTASLIHLVLLFAGLASILAGVFWLMLQSRPKYNPYLKTKT